MALSRALPGDKIPDGGRGFWWCAQKTRGHTIALTTIAFDASNAQVVFDVQSTFAQWDDVIDCIA